MKLTIDHDSSTPPYEQLRRGIIEQVRSGELVAGSKIPTVRQLAEDLGIAPNTVARAYRELEQDAVLETRGRQGSFISSSGDPTRDHAGRAATEYVAAIRKLGLADSDALAFVESALAASKDS
ncbi:GntR family transcriptional regulator [Antrihabitans cavernicola]|uniref:GntR family transcriptional regulator n=1 Tax=Antrihabitans cavernicola TaxID=2495913 RepID=A0A5A7SD21_9NOCA|nr:GntR family transcriptional regulator [Spelaeibacter cavernicola]KAA0023806.1 GntR family transcriptional regulator [Spelaeibacter cavernicola]